MSQKLRSLSIAYAKSVIGSTITPLQAPWYSFDGTMASVNNHWPPPPRTTGDVGGPWVQTYIKDVRSILAVDVTTLGKRIVGDTVITGWPNLAPTDTGALKSEANARGFGATAIARVEPTAEYFSGATALGELVNDGFPGGIQLDQLRDRTKAARSAGSGYLSAEFGWLPMVRDVRTLFRAVDRSDQIMTSYLQGSDKRIRRRYTGPEVTSQIALNGGSFSVGPDFGSVLPPVSGSTSISQSTKLWFSGAFRYHIPASVANSNISRFALEARKVYGMEITPEVLWNLAPWSWAADWFGNIGDVMHNVSALGRDGLVMEYGYVMNERKTDASYVCRSRLGTYTRDVTTVDRRRWAAISPYGFSVSWDGLTPKQLAVVTALGLTRGPR